MEKERKAAIEAAPAPPELPGTAAAVAEAVKAMVAEVTEAEVAGTAEAEAKAKAKGATKAAEEEDC